jgi:hypothetical protein
MYDISNPAEPRLASQLWLGGSIAEGGPVTVGPEALASIGLAAQPSRAEVQGVKIQGGPQMLQLRCVHVHNEGGCGTQVPDNFGEGVTSGYFKYPY